MWLRRWAILVLIATVWSCPSARGSQAVEPRAKETPNPVVRVTERVVLSPPVSRRESTSPLLGFRRKAVLEETQTQVSEGSDLGPVPLPSPYLVVRSRALMPSRSLALRPLRC